LLFVLESVCLPYDRSVVLTEAHNATNKDAS